MKSSFLVYYRPRSFGHSVITHVTGPLRFYFKCQHLAVYGIKLRNLKKLEPNFTFHFVKNRKTLFNDKSSIETSNSNVS